VPDPYPIDPTPAPEDCVTARGNLLRLWVMRRDDGRSWFKKFRDAAVGVCADRNAVQQIINSGPPPYFIRPECQPMLDLTCDRNWLLLKFYRALMTRLEGDVDTAFDAIDCTASDWESKLAAVRDAMRTYQQTIRALQSDLNDLLSSLQSCENLCRHLLQDL
jgi:hypothetical protein